MFSFIRALSQRPARRRLARRGRFAESLEPRLLLTHDTHVVDANWSEADGGMKDVNTKLVWSRGDHGSWDYKSALTHVSNLDEGGMTDWRLATEAELKEAVSHGLGNHAYNANGGLTQNGSVSSTPAGGPQKSNPHMFVSFFDGTSSVVTDAGLYRIVAVRGTRLPVTYSNPGIRVYSQQLSLGEGGVDRFTVALDTQPTGDVMIPVASSDPLQGTVAVTILTFTPSNWNVPQGVTVTVIDDAYYNPGRQFSIVLGAATSSDVGYNNGLDPADVTVMVVDNERAFTVSVSGAGDDRIVSENGLDGGVVMVQLKSRPRTAGNVYIEMSSLDLTEGTVSPQTLTFDWDNWDVKQSVYIQGVADNTFDGDQTFLVRAEVGSLSLPEFLVGSPSQQFSVKCIDINGIPQTYYSNGVALAIPNPGTVTSTIVVPAGAGRIGDVNVSLDITHPHVGELTAVLIAPGSQRIQLFDRIGGSGDNFTGTILDDEVPDSQGFQTAPFTGTFFPATELGLVDKSSAVGEWKLEVTDYTNYRNRSGTLNSWSLDFSLSSLSPPPLVAASLPATSSQQSLTAVDFQPIVAEAFRRWELAGASTTALAGVNVQVADLSGATLGQAAGNTIWLDRNGAGWGWFVDPTPGDDSEFWLAGNQGEHNRMDLLTVVMHELGHVLGYDHDADGVMAETLATGMRRTDLEHDQVATLDQVFAPSDDDRADAWLGI